LVKVYKKNNEAQPITRHTASCADAFCPAPPPVRLGLVVCPVGYIKGKSQKKESKKKEKKKTKKEKSERTRPGVLRRVHRRFPVAVFFFGWSLCCILSKKKSRKLRSFLLRIRPVTLLP
jgi:hypothetical protein